MPAPRSSPWWTAGGGRRARGRSGRRRGRVRSRGWSWARAATGRRPSSRPSRPATGRGRGVALARVPAPPGLEGVTLPGHAFHYASRPGGVVTEDGGDAWRPADPALGPGGLRIELAPPSVLLRNVAIARLRPYLYTPNTAT